VTSLQAVLATAWLVVAAVTAEPRSVGHQLLCAEFTAGQVIAQSTNHRLQATLGWQASRPIGRSSAHMLLQGCQGQRFNAELFKVLFEDRFQL